MRQIDSLDTLALLGDRERFAASVEWIGKNLRFDIVSSQLIKSNAIIQTLTYLFSLDLFCVALGCRIKRFLCLRPLSGSLEDCFQLILLPLIMPRYQLIYIAHDCIYLPIHVHTYMMN